MPSSSDRLPLAHREIHPPPPPYTASLAAADKSRALNCVRVLWRPGSPGIVSDNG